jgi:hypothetical protein
MKHQGKGDGHDSTAPALSCRQNKTRQASEGASTTDACLCLLFFCKSPGAFPGFMQKFLGFFNGDCALLANFNAGLAAQALI